MLRCVIIISTARSFPEVPGKLRECLPALGRLHLILGAGAPRHGLTAARGLRRPAPVVLLLVPVYQIIERQAAFLGTCSPLQGFCNPTGHGPHIAAQAEPSAGTAQTRRKGSAGPGLCVGVTKQGGDTTGAARSASESQSVETQAKHDEKTH